MRRANHTVLQTHKALILCHGGWKQGKWYDAADAHTVTQYCLRKKCKCFHWKSGQQSHFNFNDVDLRAPKS